MSVARLDPGALRLVAITDSLRDGVDGLVERARGAVAGGATMLQVRLKDESARTLVEVARALCVALPSVPVLVNARTDVALAAGAAGVHLGVDDMPAAAVRRVVPPAFIIGVSVGDGDPAAALVDADYAAVGPVFVASSGVEAARGVGLARIRELSSTTSCPVLAVGGIDVTNAASVVRAGAAGIAVISAVFGAADPTTHARALRAALDASGR